MLHIFLVFMRPHSFGPLWKQISKKKVFRIQLCILFMLMSSNIARKRSDSVIYYTYLYCSNKNLQSVAYNFFAQWTRIWSHNTCNNLLVHQICLPCVPQRATMVVFVCMCVWGGVYVCNNHRVSLMFMPFSIVEINCYIISWFIENLKLYFDAPHENIWY